MSATHPMRTHTYSRLDVPQRTLDDIRRALEAALSDGPERLCDYLMDDGSICLPGIRLAPCEASLGPDDIAEMVATRADSDCQGCDGSGIFYGNVCLCSCVNRELHETPPDSSGQGVTAESLGHVLETDLFEMTCEQRQANVEPSDSLDDDDDPDGMSVSGVENLRRCLHLHSRPDK